MEDSIREEPHDFEGYCKDLSDLIDVLEQKSSTAGNDVLVYIERVEKAISCLYLIKDIFPDIENINVLAQQFNLFHQELNRKLKNGNHTRQVAFFKQTHTFESIEGACRPKYYIPEKTLIYFKSLGFRWNDIANMLLLSIWTIRRRVREYGLDSVVGFSTLTNDESDQKVSSYCQTHGLAVGRSMITGFLNSEDIRVQKRRVTQSLVRVDPVGS